MTNYRRLSRKERDKLSGKRKAPLALALAVLLLILVVIQSRWSRLKEFILPENYAAIQSSADSLIAQTGRGFMLSDTAYVDSILNQTNVHGNDNLYRRYRQPWPGALPFEFYVQRLQKACKEIRLTCDCRESGEDYLTCLLGKDDFIGASVILNRSAGTRLRGRRVAFLIENLGALDNDEIMDILESGINFSYMATPDVYPSGTIRMALEKAGISSLLEIPTDKSTLIDLVRHQSTRKKSGPDRQDDRDLVETLFARHPNPAAIMIKRLARIDSSFVREIIRETKKRKAAYIYNHARPDAIDSLAYSNGLLILHMNQIADFSDAEFDSLRPTFLQELIFTQGLIKRIAVFDGASIKVSVLVSLKKSFDSLGVNLLDTISLMEIRESL